MRPAAAAGAAPLFVWAQKPVDRIELQVKLRLKWSDVTAAEGRKLRKRWGREKGNFSRLRSSAPVCLRLL